MGCRGAIASGHGILHTSLARASFGMWPSHVKASASCRMFGSRMEDRDAVCSSLPLAPLLICGCSQPAAAKAEQCSPSNPTFASHWPGGFTHGDFPVSAYVLQIFNFPPLRWRLLQSGLLTRDPARTSRARAKRCLRRSPPIGNEIVEADGPAPFKLMSRLERMRRSKGTRHQKVIAPPSGTTCHHHHHWT